MLDGWAGNYYLLIYVGFMYYERVLFGLEDGNNGMIMVIFTFLVLSVTVGLVFVGI